MMITDRVKISFTMETMMLLENKGRSVNNYMVTEDTCQNLSRKIGTVTQWRK